MIIDSTTHISTWRLEEIISAYHSFKIQSQLILQQTKKKINEGAKFKEGHPGITQPNHFACNACGSPYRGHCPHLNLAVP
jgi:hypothetical protein